MSKADELFGKTHYYKQNDIKEEGKLKRIEYRANLNEFIDFDVEKNIFTLLEIYQCKNYKQ